jgi:hypothetical protein
MLKKSTLIWLSIIPLAILNGGFREMFLISWFGESLAEFISVIILCLMIFIISLIFIPRIGKGSPKTYWKIGGLWIFLTIIFETVLGLALGNSFSELLQAYDITAGNFWLIVVLFIGIAPWLVVKIKQII